MGLRENVEQVRTRLEKAAARFGHKPQDVTLVAVTKTVEADVIREAIALGLTDIGENRVQEMSRKREAYAGARLHMIGQLQSNKVRQLPPEVVLVQSVDRLSLLNEMERIGARDGRDFLALIEIAIAGEAQKGGCAVEALPELLEAVEEMQHVRVNGLMCVAPAASDPEDVRPYFRKMRSLFDKTAAIGYNKTQMNVLSMGMTHDFEVALEEGSNMVRIGTALFGSRNIGGGDNGTVG
ncbi:MAG: YggS family pyridoxal phosphate-dependent enzyme [Peptoniphilaceae bacterium]|nr:YggS family pyridoxal phosphate-dependent enzyme [Peptoniphilaceae bacterium]MDY6086011.1 YggS family pyridoxal phosphate-dependent enzyme [Peptoniphilaceae bacterium]